MCIFCGGKVEKSITEYLEKIGNYIIVIKNVPCEECTQCGETYFSHEVAVMLDEILRSIQIISSELTVTVIDYRKKTA